MVTLSKKTYQEEIVQNAEYLIIIIYFHATKIIRARTTKPTENMIVQV